MDPTTLSQTPVLMLSDVVHDSPLPSFDDSAHAYPSSPSLHSPRSPRSPAFQSHSPPFALHALKHEDSTVAVPLDVTDQSDDGGFDAVLLKQELVTLLNQNAGAASAALMTAAAQQRTERE